MSPTKSDAVLVWVPHPIQDWCYVEEHWCVELSITDAIDQFQETVMNVLVYKQWEMMLGPLL